MAVGGGRGWGLEVSNFPVEFLVDIDYLIFVP
jgi:hypothetical protein